jgi:hypothetical protein
MMTFGQEGFNEVLVGTDVRTSRSSWNMGNIIGPLESLLIGNKCGMINGITARVTPDFVVPLTCKAAGNDYTDDCAKHETTDA